MRASPAPAAAIEPAQNSLSHSNYTHTNALARYFFLSLMAFMYGIRSSGILTGGGIPFALPNSTCTNSL